MTAVALVNDDNDTLTYTWFVVIGVQVLWLSLQLAYLYTAHYVDNLTSVNLAALHRLPHGFTRDLPAWRDLSLGQIRGMFWWQNWSDETPLHRLPIRGTHHSTTYTINNVLSLFAKTQKHTLVEQLNRGVRCLDVRLKSDGDTSSLLAYHDFVDLNLPWRRVWTAIESWLGAFPSEGLLLSIRDESYRDHFRVVSAALDQLDPRTRDRVILLNDREFGRSAELTVGQLRGRVFVWNANDRKTMPWSDDRGFSIGAIRVNDRYNAANTVDEKLEICRRFYETTDADRLNVLFTSMANSNVFTSIQSRAYELNQRFYAWLSSSGSPVKGCVFMEDWVK